MKILLYNIDHGGRTKNLPTGRWKILSQIIRTINPDCMILLEAWGWRASELKTFARRAGFPFYYLSPSNTKHNLAYLAVAKPRTIRSTKAGMHHSLLDIILPNGITLIGIHLSPVNEQKRLKEVDIVLARIKKNQPTLIIGDFNSLSPADRYNQKKLLKTFREKNITKFGKHKLETRVIAKILAAGLIDITKKYHRQPTVYYSVPTKIATDVDHAAQLRLDYGFVTPTLAKNITKANIIKNPLTNRASDHFPLVLELRTPNNNKKK